MGHHFYWLSPSDGGPLPELFYDTPLRSLAKSLVAPGEIEIAFNHLQVALNIPPFSNRPGGHHLDGYQEGHRVPATFTMLAGALMTELGHQRRWRECLCDDLLEFDPVRAALDQETA